MGNSSHFASTPSIAIPRTMMKMKPIHSCSFYHGELIPLGAGCLPVLPGDTISLTISSLIRMSTPIAPIMDDLEASIVCFFVPYRLVNDSWEEIITGKSKTSITAPTFSTKVGLADCADNGIHVGSVAHHLGKPAVSEGSGWNVNPFKERSYWLICNEWFRPEQIETPIIINKSNSSNLLTIATQGANSINFDSDPYVVSKDFDYFTAATKEPQWGPSVSISFGDTAKVITGSEFDVEGNDPLKFINVDDGTIPENNPLYLTTNGTLDSGAFVSGSGDVDFDVSQTAGMGIAPTNLYADLKNATGATINDIRYAFALQKYFERSNFGNDRYFEVLKVHYGVTSPDARLQRPEYLGGTKFYININQVVATADTTQKEGEVTPAGTTGAVSVTGNKSHIFTKSFVEFGTIMSLVFVRQKNQTYAQGLMREDTKSDRFEFYTPELCNLGDQAVLNKEIYANSIDDGEGDDVFGYQEHWAEYRYRQNIVSGVLDPNYDNGLDYWTLANKFESLPELDEDFIKESRSNLARALTTGQSGPDYIGQFLFDFTAVRPMPAYTIPGLIDHFGVR